MYLLHFFSVTLFHLQNLEFDWMLISCYMLTLCQRIFFQQFRTDSRWFEVTSTIILLASYPILPTFVAKMWGKFDLFECVILWLRIHWRLSTIIKSSNKSVWSNGFWYVKVYIFWKFIQYSIHWDKAQM